MGLNLVESGGVPIIGTGSTIVENRPENLIGEVTGTTKVRNRT